MKNIREYYEEVSQMTTEHLLNGTNFVIYKGFKLSKTGDNNYKIEDVRFSNMYSPLTNKDKEVIQRDGIIKGADTISYRRDKRRIKSYTKRTERLYNKRRRFERELPSDKRLNEKRIRNINLLIDEFLNMKFFYEVRVEQFKIKYKLK